MIKVTKGDKGSWIVDIDGGDSIELYHCRQHFKKSRPRLLKMIVEQGLGLLKQVREG